jgi:hypothetical protein
VGWFDSDSFSPALDLSLIVVIAFVSWPEWNALLLTVIALLMEN